MTKLLILLAALAATANAAGPFFFIQASDPQFGMFTGNKDFTQETANWTFAIANINRLHPAFLIVTGDLVNKAADPAQIAEYKRINRELDPSIHLYSVPGNHDVENDPTPESLAAYRKNIGPDYYSFREGPIYGIVLDSNLIKSPGKVKQEAAKQETWLEGELEKAKSSGAMTVIFLHIPPFLETPGEAETYNSWPLETRARILALLHRYNVHNVFAGHLHHNLEAKDGDLEITCTAAAGKPIGKDPSGFRVIEVEGASLKQNYYGYGQIPNVYPVPVPAPK